MLVLEPRQSTSRVMVYLAPLFALAFTLLSGLVLFSIFGEAPLKALYVFFLQPLSNLYGLTELGVKAVPLALIAVGLALGFRANVWNIGAEGQLTLGAITASALALAFYEVDSLLLLPAMALAGILGGGAWAAVPAFLKTRFNVSEILTSLMLTYVATLFLSVMVQGPLRDPEGFNFPESRLFHDAALLPLAVADSRLHIGIYLALLIAATAWVLLSRSLIGFQLKVLGAAPQAARYVGFKGRGLIWFCLLLSGGLAGLAGMIEIAGPIGQLLPSVSPGYGFTAIIVAFLGRLHPVGVCLAALVVSLTYLGGETAQIELGLPAAVTGLFQGILLFSLLACDVLSGYRIRLRRFTGKAAS